MTMMQKVQAKKSKKGFTLVELVIVIAILAILAAIAIPVITTTINSSKLSVMESDTTTVNMLLKEAINNRLAKQKNVKYDSVEATDDSLTVQNVLKANDMKYGSDFFTRDIGGTDYMMVAEASGGTLKISVQTSGTAIKEGDTIKAIAQGAGLEKKSNS